MLTFLATSLKKGFRRVRREPTEDEVTPIFESLAMTEELREALFPTQPRMVSAIFDRPSPMSRTPAYVPPPARTPAAGERPFPILF
jgi:hypothetical protein